MYHNSLLESRLDSQFLHRLQNNIFSYPYAAYGKDEYGDFGHARITPKEIALTMPVLQVNSHRCIRYLCFDVDRPDASTAWRDTGLPPPNSISVNPRNGHAHLVWELTEPVWLAKKGDHRAKKALPEYFLNNLITAMGKALGADPSYNHVLTKNPLHSQWKTTFPAQTTYTMGELRQNLDLPRVKHSFLKTRIAKDTDESYKGPNCALFRELADKSYGLKGFYDDYDLLHEHILENGIELNNTLVNPMVNSEVRGIVRSIAKYIFYKMTGTRGVAKVDHTLSPKERCRLGQQYMIRKRVNKSISKISSAIEKLISESHGLTWSSIASVSGVSRPTVNRHKAKILELYPSLDSLIRETLKKRSRSAIATRFVLPPKSGMSSQSFSDSGKDGDAPLQILNHNTTTRTHTTIYPDMRANVTPNDDEKPWYDDLEYQALMRRLTVRQQADLEAQRIAKEQETVHLKPGRHPFTAVVVGFGKQKQYKNPDLYEPTIILGDVVNQYGKPVISKIQKYYGMAFQKTDLKAGDRIRFTARFAKDKWGKKILRVSSISVLPPIEVTKPSERIYWMEELNNSIGNQIQTIH